MWTLPAPTFEKQPIHANLSVWQAGAAPVGRVEKKGSGSCICDMRQKTFNLSVELNDLMSLPISTTAMLKAKSEEWCQKTNLSQEASLPQSSVTRHLAQLDQGWLPEDVSPDKIDYLIGVFSHAMAHLPPETRASLRELTQYLKANIQHPQTHLLLSELSSFFHSMMQSKSTDIIRNTLAIFPPKNREDFKCVEGTRARLMEALTFFQRETGCQQGIEGELKAKLASGIDEVAQKVYMTEKLASKVTKDYQIHVMPYLYQLAGVSKQTLLQKDTNALLPARFFTAQEAGRLSHQLRNTQTPALQEAKNILKSQMEDFFQAISSHDFSGSHFHEVTNHSLVTLLKGYQPDFDLASEKYITENLETGTYAWNTEEIFNDIKIILKTHFLSEDIHPSLKYKENFSAQDVSESITALLSDNVDQKEKAFHLLSLFSDDVEDNSPALFVHILMEAAQKTKESSLVVLADDEKTQAVFKLLDSLKNELKNQPHLSDHLKEVEARWKKIAGTPEHHSREIKAYWDMQHKNPAAILNKSHRVKLDESLSSKLHRSNNHFFMSYFIYIPSQIFLNNITNNFQEKEKKDKLYLI